MTKTIGNTTVASGSSLPPLNIKHALWDGNSWCFLFPRKPRNAAADLRPSWFRPLPHHWSKIISSPKISIGHFCSKVHHPKQYATRRPSAFPTPKMIMKHISQGSLVTSVANKLHLSPTLQINELVQQTRASGKKVVHLGFGEATFPIEKGVLEEHRNASAMTSYLPVAGLQALREASLMSTQRSGVPPLCMQLTIP
jgi:hypothetical protein